MTNVLETPKITDHQIIEIELYKAENDKDANTTIDFYTRDYSNFSEQGFCDELNTIIDDKYDENKDTNIVAHELIQLIVEALNIVAPQIKKTVPMRWKEKPWITNEVRKQSEERDIAYKMAKSTNTQDVWD